MPGRSSRRAGRSPGLVNLAVVVGLVIALTGIALTSRTTSPPAIAEFAPQAVQQIKKAPKQAGEEGEAGGSAASPPASPSPSPGASPAAAPSPSAAATTGPAAELTVADTCANGLQNKFDPQSPPCLPFYPKGMDNFGATARGVTGDTILIGYNNPVGEPLPHAEVMAQFFSQRFVTYHRTIKIVRVEEEWRAGHNGWVACQYKCSQPWRAAADAIAQKGVFAVVGEFGSPEFQFQLARKGVISIDTNPQFTERYAKQYHPYVWAYSMYADQQAERFATYICQKWAGKPARWVGGQGATQNGSPRKWAIFVYDATGGSMRVLPDILRSKLSTCGIRIEDKHVRVHAGESDRETNASAAFMLETVKDKVSSVIAIGPVYAVTNHSESQYRYQGYYPEYFTPSFSAQDNNFVVGFNGSTQEGREHRLGVSFNTKHLKTERVPAYYTLRYFSKDWTFDPSRGATFYEVAYKPLLVLASGIQGAGPRLTPQSFADGLHRMEFPNPADSRNLGKVGFLNGDHSMLNDGMEMYWQNGAAAPDGGSGSGAFCYPYDRRAGSDNAADWGSQTDRYFAGNPDCDTGIRS